MDAEGVKLISRASYEMSPARPDRRTTIRFPAVSTENDAILVMDKVLIPWENVLIYRDLTLPSLDHGRRFCPHVPPCRPACVWR
ncbi:4-hydroxyphenylacetate 3-monooxygenase [Klebsiella pneumoniae]|uniref:4-hydroxyphenylacetate 3-monooxygenase n=1 Tax=Klebsiella pneumoniae TaxID=573 RepID=A0A2X3GVW4_KLEPN|nr:4-hydroxyphenylacetate 3-monooxygenase [Klebsiella pneumoniae]